jgi:hypothetical protein
MSRAPFLFRFGTTATKKIKTQAMLSFEVSGGYFERIKTDSHTAGRAHAVPMPCRAAKGLEYVFPI